jgi:hypothetical protein
MYITTWKALTEKGDVSSLSISNIGVGGFDPLEDEIAERDFDGGPENNFRTAVG